MPKVGNTNGLYCRNKGKRGEREVAKLISDLLGFEVKRNHGGTSCDDLEGVPGWSIEVKNCSKDERRLWWAQTVLQARRADKTPVLIYRLPRKGWRAVWPVFTVALLTGEQQDWWYDYEWTAETSVEAWAAVVREGL